MPVKKLSDLPQKTAADNGDGFVITSVTGQDMRVPFQNLGITKLKSDVDDLQANQLASTIGFETKALMDADLAYDAGTVAQVMNDATSANNGYYRKDGASGAGSWVKRASLYAETLDPDDTSEAVTGKAVAGHTANRSNLFEVEFFRSSAIDSATGNIVSNPTGSWYGSVARKLESVEKIEFKALTYNSGQPTIYFYDVSDGYDSYTLIESRRYTAVQTLRRSDFPAGATHYMINAIVDLTPDVYCDEYSFPKTEAINNRNDIEDLYEFSYNESGLILPALFDTNNSVENMQINTASGRPTSAVSGWLSEFSDVQKNVTYITNGFLSAAWGFDREKNYVGEITVVNNSEITVSDDDVWSIRCSFASQGHNLFVKKYTVNDTLGNQVGIPYDGKKVFDYNSLKRPIQGFGDSLISKGSVISKLSTKSGHPALRFSYGGTTSPFIRDRFEEFGTFDNGINLFWVGQNNPDEPDQIISDIKYMVRLLTHERFLIATFLNGGNPNSSFNDDYIARVEEVEKRVEEIWGPKSILINRAVLAGAYDMGGVQLQSSFTQPAVNSTVVVEVSDVDFFQTINSADEANTFIPSQDFVLIGYGDVYDEYEVTASAIDGAGDGKEGTLTLKLIKSNRIGVGGTVENITETDTASGSATSYNYSKYLKVIKKADKFCIDNKMTPSSFRDDGIHPSARGGDCISDLFSWRLSSLPY